MANLRFIARALVPVALPVLLACSGSDDVDLPYQGPVVEGGAGGSSGALVCLDENRQQTAKCAVTPVGSLCELASNNDCAKLVLEEVSASDGQSGPCLRLVIENVCDQVLYSWTCIEHTSGAVDWQCWLSTTYPGGDIDVGECHATGTYLRWSSLSSGELDVIYDRCHPLG